MGGSRPGALASFLAAAIVLLAPGAAPSPVWAADSPELQKLQAAYLLNFARYTTWPESAFADERGPIAIGVTGDDALLAYLEDLVEGETAGGRRIVVRSIDLSPIEAAADRDDRAALTARLRGLHILFIGAPSSRHVPWVLERLEGHHVLTVSDISSFAERGGMIELVLRNRRLAFDVSVEAIERCRLSMSSRVLRLARIVETRSS